MVRRYAAVFRRDLSKNRVAVRVPKAVGNDLDTAGFDVFVGHAGLTPLQTLGINVSVRRTPVRVRERGSTVSFGADR